MHRRNLFCLTLLTSLALFCPTFIQAAVANNPGIAIAGGISGKDVLCTGSTSTYNATLEWPPGVSHFFKNAW